MYHYRPTAGRLTFRLDAAGQVTMSDEDLLRNLHDRATRGVPLFDDERNQLDQWYARQDHGEAATLSRTATSGSVDRLQAEVNAALSQVAVVMSRIQSLIAENEAARRELAVLQGRLAQRLTPHSA
jgi:hypothetical protein